MKHLLTFLMGVAALTFTSAASADVTLYQTDFEAPTFNLGNLVPQDGWVNHSGSGSLVQVVSGGGGQQAELVQGGGSREDASVGLGYTLGSFNGPTDNIFNYAFDVIVSSTEGGADATTTYFAHFKDDGTGFNTRIFVAAPNVATNNFTFAIGETSSSTVAAAFATDFTYDTTYNLSGSYNFVTGISTLTVDGGSTIDSTAQADPGEDLSFFAFRQSGGNTSQRIDNLVVTANYIPEPGTMGILALLSGLGFIRRRK